ncbi:WD40/YVTN/BNR-like repeat-containing protein [Paraconexibacter sp.]|uniref:WD40/YVTN/BNR-like repeat-containing protein n=1 Tax=Paraconexibacter sp. TaxID=2949640 RepID=UPI003567A93B
MRRTRTALALVAVGALLTGCGSDRLSGPEGGGASQAAGAGNRLVDLEQQPPYVNSLGVDPRTEDLLLSTNRGFFRIDRDGGKVTEISGTVRAGSRSAPVGTFLSFLAVDDGERLIGSGHPDTQALPEFLGFIASTDGGESWKSLARLGEADLHKLVVRHDRLYAYDAVLAAMLISDDDGSTFKERFTPRGLVIDFVVDPQDPETIVAATEDQLYRSTDDGGTWRALLTGIGMRLDWPARGGIVRADRDGTVFRSTDRGTTWKKVGSVQGEPYKIVEDRDGALLMALADATILRSTDGARTWTPIFRP